MQLRPRRLVAPLVAVSAMAVLSACAGAPGLAAADENAELVQGPPISDIVTPFDEALSCLDGRISPSIVFAVGAILDQTGKESFTDGGVGKFVTQGAGDMVQSALFKAGATLVNRRDPRITTTEAEWGIRNIATVVPTNFYITGSINSLDFIPGSGAEVNVAGVGPRYRQNRMLVGLDLAMTNAATGQIVANVPLQKQIFQSEAGIGLGRFFGDTLISGDIGGREREALNFALRQMLNLATFELLTQLMSAENFAECRSHVDRAYGYVDNTETAEAVAALNLETTRLPLPPDARPSTRARATRTLSPVADSNGSVPATQGARENLVEQAARVSDADSGKEPSTQERARAQAILAN